MEPTHRTALDRLIPTPRLLELDHVDVAAAPAEAWELVRHADFGESPLVHALFAIRTLPGRLLGRAPESASFRIDDLRSSPEHPGFQRFVEDAPREVAIAAIGKVWQLDIPFVHVASVEAYATFHEPDYVKVAWAVRVLPHGERDARVEIEVRVDATSDDAWRRFRRYFRVIGIGSHLIRHSILRSLAGRLGVPEAQENVRPLLGDELIGDADLQVTHGVTIDASPERIFPWLAQMGRGRAGFYSIDLLDNGGQRSAREVHPELTQIAVGDRIPATAEGDAGFEVLRFAPGRALVLGGLFDADERRQLAFNATRPSSFWQVTWAFVLEPLDDRSTRLHVRGRAAAAGRARRRLFWELPVHHLMERAQLRHLKARVEQRAAADWRDVASGLGGAAIMAAALLSPLLRARRNHWGLDRAAAERWYPGDELVRDPRWSWTHGVEIDAPAEHVWPWVAQIGADRGGFYSYAWLENLAGCGVANAERVHPEWQVRPGDALRLHPEVPPLPIVDLEPGRHFVAHGAPDEAAQARGEPWAAVTWLFLVEPMGTERCRVISRYRCATSDDLRSRLTFGPALVEPIGFAMDRRMLLGVKERAERQSRARLAGSTADRAPAAPRA